MIRTPEYIRIAITMNDGSLRVMSFITKEHGGVSMTNGEVSKGWTREPSVENINSEITRSNPEAVSWRIINESEILIDRYFRNAWKDTGNKIDVDMIKARDIQRDKIREVRAPLLAALDTQYMKADEMNDKTEKTRIAAEKQRLRDFTKDPRIEVAKTPEELKGILP